jgi:hypothetical protein
VVAASGCVADFIGGSRECPHCDPKADFAAEPSGQSLLAKSCH